MMSQKPIPLDIFHPAIAALLARAPVAPQPKEGEAAYRKHKYASASGDTDTHLHAGTDTGKPLHAPKRLVPGEPVAPWLFDFDFLLPSEPLLMCADTEGFLDELAPDAADAGGPVYRDAVSREARDAEQALLEDLFGVPETQTEAETGTAAPAVQEPKHEQERPEHSAPLTTKKSTQQRESAAEGGGTTMSLSALFQSLWAKELGSGLNLQQAQKRFVRREQQLSDARNTVQFKSIVPCTPPGGKHQFPDKAATVLSVLDDSMSREERAQLKREYVQYKHQECIYLDVDDRNAFNSSSSYAKQSYRWWAKNEAGTNSAGKAEGETAVPILTTPGVMATPPPHIPRNDASMYVVHPEAKASPRPQAPAAPFPSFRRR